MPSDAPVLSRRTLLRAAVGVGLTAVATPLLSACSSGDDRIATLAAPETTTIRLPKVVFSSSAAQAVASEFLQQEGFTDVQYVTLAGPEVTFTAFAAGDFDMTVVPAPMAAFRIDAGDPIVILGGINAGGFQIFASDAVKSLSDLKGKVLSTGGPGLPDDVFLTLILANVGIDARKDARVITHNLDEAVRALISGEIDAMTAVPPFSNRLRDGGVGHVLLDVRVDGPWSQYFNAMPAVRRDFLTKNPAATKRALRAYFKAADVVAKDPERGARAMRAQGFIPESLYTATLNELPMIPYDVWRKYDPANTLRFYALRLKEAGLIKSTPDQVIRRGTDFRFFQDLKRELKEA